MSLIKSISGIRGTIGGQPGDNLTPIDAVKFAAAYGTFLKNANAGKRLTVVIGRDARISGEMVSGLVTTTLQGLGIDVVDLGLSTTPTVEVMVPELAADGGIILTASHNPKEWNALKLLNSRGEFLSGTDGAQILKLVEAGEYEFAPVDELGKLSRNDHAINIHIDKILALPMVNAEAIRQKHYKVVLDAVNSTGALAVPPLLKKLGCEVVELYCEPNGDFPHNPEPLREHLSEIMQMVPATGADFGIVVDPDVDRLALIDEKGEMFGEEYTLVAVADYILKHKQGSAVSNLSSSRALKDVALAHGGTYHASAVGEVNVVEMMKAQDAVIGGEGNGGIIYPDLHYGRDSLVGIALFLSHLAEQNLPVSTLRAGYPPYFMGKKKIELTAGIDVDAILAKMQEKYESGASTSHSVTTVDGVKIDFPEKWVHLRKSNTEPIIRIYTEAATQQEADALGEDIIAEIKSLI